MMRRRTGWLLAALALALPGCDATTPRPAAALRVLFIGSSLTYTNDLPYTLSQLSAQAGLEPCYCISISHPNFALEDHYNAGEAEAMLDTVRFDFVVMQQGPSALPESRVNLVYYAEQFAPIIARNGATPVMLSVWPSPLRQFDFPNVRDSYRAAADAIGALFAPAGGAWLAAWELDPTLSLYAGDGHPTFEGTYLAALVLFEQLYARNPTTLPRQAHVGGTATRWPADFVGLLQEAAATANARER